MLSALLEDFRALDRHEIVTCIGESVKPAEMCGDRLLGARAFGVPTAMDFKLVFQSLLQEVDAALVVAPETAGVLADLTEAIERSGRLLLGSSSAAVRTAGDKLICFETWLKRGVPTPPTIAVQSTAEAAAAARLAGFPLVVKPADGAGSTAAYRVSRTEDLLARLPTTLDESSDGVAVVQPWVEGVAASVSLLVGDGRIVPLSLNAQEIAVADDDQISYLGGVVPLAHADRDRAFATAAAAADAIPGLRGYVGVDLVLTADGPVCLELNPRLTTAYVGLRHAIRDNLAERILTCALQGDPGALPALVETVRFGKSGVCW